MSIDRELPNDEARRLLSTVRGFARDELAPRASTAEAAGAFPRDVVTAAGSLGLLGLPYPREYGGGQCYYVYLQVIEEIATAWLTIAETIAVHTLSCFPVATAGTDEQRRRWLPDMVGGQQLGAYCLSEPAAGSDAGALKTRATRENEQYRVNGVKAWITHAGHADFYNLLVRTGQEGPKGISCLFVNASTPGLSTAPPEDKMGLRASPVAEVHLDDALVPAVRLVGEEGQGFSIALAALDCGRLGIAATAVGLAQSALDVATRYASTREQFGRPIGDFQGVGFMLADMATAVEAGRALYLAAARRKDSGQPVTRHASMAKLFCTEMAMQVATDAVQILGAAGYTTRFPVERYLREAKVLQIFEGTNQIQRLVISRKLLASV